MFRKSDVLLQEINYKFIAKMTNLGIMLDWIADDPFKKYKIRHQKVDKEFLTEKELKSIEKKNFDIERLMIVKDVFVFCCYTGLAYVDVTNLTPNNIVTGLTKLFH